MIIPNKNYIINSNDIIDVAYESDTPYPIITAYLTGNKNTKPNYLPTRYIVNDGAVILFWSDGDKTIVKRAKDDKNDPVKGFLWAYFIKHSGLSRTKANKYLRNLDKED